MRSFTIHQYPPQQKKAQLGLVQQPKGSPHFLRAFLQAEDRKALLDKFYPTK
jgi:hypothetical protein